MAIKTNPSLWPLFRSPGFIVATFILVLFAYSDVGKLRAIQGSEPCTSRAIFLLILFPIIACFGSLFAHWEIRRVIETIQEAPPPYSRLNKLPQGLILAVTIMSYAVTEALTASCFQQFHR
jgi:hypothetical protein